MTPITKKWLDENFTREADFSTFPTSTQPDFECHEWKLHDYVDLVISNHPDFGYSVNFGYYNGDEKEYTSVKKVKYTEEVLKIVEAFK